MALDEEHRRLFVSMQDQVFAYDLGSASTTPRSSFTAILPPGWSMTFRPAVTVTVEPSVHRMFVHNNQIFASIHTGELAVFPMVGASMMPVNLPSYRLLTTSFGPSTNFAARSCGNELFSTRTVELATLDRAGMSLRIPARRT